MVLGVDVLKPVASGAILGGGSMLIQKKNGKQALKIGATQAGSLAASEFILGRVNLPSILGFLEQSYGPDVLGSFLYALSAHLMSSKDGRGLNKFIFAFLTSLGANVGAAYIEGPLRPYAPSFLLN
jgi:hypothetical protein